MATSNREKLKELQTALEQIEGWAKLVEQKINENQTFLDQISQHKTSAEQWRGEIETTKSQLAEAHGEIKVAKVKISITDKGVAIGETEFYKFSEIKNFSLIFRTKQLYFKSKNLIKPSFSVPIDGADQLKIQKILLKYLPENLSRKSEPLEDRFARRLKLKRKIFL